MKALGIVIPIGGFAHLCYGLSGQLPNQALGLTGHLESNATNTTSTNPYGVFPVAGDPFHFIPCTTAFEVPSLDDPEPGDTWAATFDSDPTNWQWGSPLSSPLCTDYSMYEGRGIYLCGYLDVPLDYTNESDPRIARLAISKYQVSGLEYVQGAKNVRRSGKSSRTIVFNPGGPGGSGFDDTRQAGQSITKGLSDEQFDFLGFDPRGVGHSLPAISCFPHDTDRERASQVIQYRAASSDPKAQLELMDAIEDAILNACWNRHGDLGRFMTTAFVARDMEEIRRALGEEQLSGAFYSYGTAIAQTYANMFPNNVGRMVLDGLMYTRHERDLAGWARGFLTNSTDVWEDGFLAECLNAGPDFCALADSFNGTNDAMTLLSDRVHSLLQSLLDAPRPQYDPYIGPVLLDYAWLSSTMFRAMYTPSSWPSLATEIYNLENEGTFSSARSTEINTRSSDASAQCPIQEPTSLEQYHMVICGDSYDAPQQELSWWGNLWWNMTTSTKIQLGGDGAFLSILPCRHFHKYWTPAEVYRGDLNNTLSNPVLLVGGTYDPATPLVKARLLLNEMGENARLIVHHGYGHCSSSDASACTGALVKSYMLNGTLPSERETDCYADGKPYLRRFGTFDRDGQDPNFMAMIDAWQEIMADREFRRLQNFRL